MELASQLQISVAQTTHEGNKESNEDCMGVRIPDADLLATKGAAIAIADGVSSAEIGRQASETCVQNFLTDYFSTPEPWTVRTSVETVLAALNRWLYAQGRHLKDTRNGHITTLSILVLKSRTAHVCHVGDTRVYWVRDHQIELLTRDHAARISADQTYLTRAMGMDERIEFDYRTLELHVGDIFVLTTDGVHDFVHEKDILSAVSATTDYDACCHGLIERALEHGSRDNLTCQIVRVDRLPLENPDELYKSLTRLPFPPPLATGQILDGYRVERELHASSRSQLYLVNDIECDRRVVMKTPSVNFSDDPGYIERFLREAWIGRRIESPHVLRIIDPERPPSAVYYLQEYVQGITLGEWIRQHPRPDAAEVIPIVEQIMRGLLAFHKRETYHQDLKPDNIMLEPGGAVRIIDFGSCDVAGIDEMASPLPRSSLLGTAGYAAPEARLGQMGGARGDQFSLGCIIYEMLTGALPYGEAIERATTQTDLERLEYTPAYHHNPNVPVWMDGALRRSVHLDPNQRYTELSELVADLRAPNAAYASDARLPLLETHPVRFWQLLCLLLALSHIFWIVAWSLSR